MKTSETKLLVQEEEDGGAAEPRGPASVETSSCLIPGATSTDGRSPDTAPTSLPSPEEQTALLWRAERGLSCPPSSTGEKHQCDDPTRRRRRRDCLRALVGDVGVALFAPLDLGLEAGGEGASGAAPRTTTEAESRSPPQPLLRRACGGRRSASNHRRLEQEVLLEAEEEDCAGSIRDHHYSSLSPLLKSSEGSLTTATTVTTTSTTAGGFEDDETEVTTDCLTAHHHHHPFATEEDDAWFCWIEPEPSIDLESCPRILTDSMLHDITKHLPPSCQGHMLERCFCIGLHGDSLLTMLHQCRSFRYTLLVIQTTKGAVLGGFATEQWNDRRHNVYFGNGQSFLFASHPDCLEGVDDDPPATGPDHALSIYPWSGVNDYCQICDPTQNRIAMGGDGEFGIIVRDHFAMGDTGRSRTFRNPPLVAGGGRFDVAALEVYGILPFSLSPPSRPLTEV